MSHFHRINVIDSHTGGEPTRVVIAGGPDLGGGPLSERVERFRDRFDRHRSAVVNEPRGSDVFVGAMLVERHVPNCAAGVIFFNNVGYLGMCGHGTIGLIVTLAHLGRIGPGVHRIDTPVGVVSATLCGDGRVAVTNVPSWRHLSGVAVEVEGHGRLTGDVAWGGNWFFISADHGQEISVARTAELTDLSVRVRQALERAGVTGADGGEIDHVELIGPPSRSELNAKNFVLCPGAAYDRSPCGTGTSAKLACLHADGKLKPGDVWRQESVIGSVFEGSIEVIDGAVVPTVVGSAYIMAESTLLIDEADALAWGIRRGPA